MTNGYTDWLIMMYMSADGLLANFAVESLKQLKRAASKDVVVVAQFETDGIIPAELYVFNGTDATQPLAVGERAPVRRQAGVKTPSAEDLRKFIDKAVSKAPHAEHHALFLWGHGPELLSNEGPRSEAEAANERRNPGKPLERRYLKPSELKSALKETSLARAGHKLDIIGLDACSMSMAELATELGEHVQFMVASQDDVPDQSFPYEAILRRLRKPANANDAGNASTMIPEVFREAYRDYLTDPRTGFRGFTLSALELSKMGSVTKALKELAGALLKLSAEPAAGQKIFKAREKAQGFVFGLFVDIVDLCDKLKASEIASQLNSACDEMQEAITGAVIRDKTHRNPRDKKVTADGKVERMHGLSVYFPYRIPDLTEQLQELRKGGGAFPRKGGGAFPRKERSQRIQELERDFAQLKQFAKTGWNKFIQQGWCAILAKEAERRHFELDEVYSAQQCAQNLSSLAHGAKSPREYEPKLLATARLSAREKRAA